MGERKTYYVYIMTNKSGTLYVGMTDNITRRLWQHRRALVEGFTKKYNITRLIHHESFTDVYSAIAREKMIKGWVRRKKLDLIESVNPQWHDLSEDCYD
ncbi:MAG: GIY-YIG nuclease family protein [Phycisphaerales bacterium]|nr:MAG: GIY-YIG nuclease family protein [Phycisphaerales bacterium]